MVAFVGCGLLGPGAVIQLTVSTVQLLSLGGGASAIGTAVGVSTAGAALGAGGAVAAGAAPAAVGQAAVMGAVSGLGTVVVATPIGWAGGVLLGCSIPETSSADYSWDCWKAVLREESSQPSQGKLLSEVLSDPRIAWWHQQGTRVLVRNVFGDSFVLDKVVLPCGTVAFHATPAAAV
jgi:hypothetical protein